MIDLKYSVNYQKPSKFVKHPLAWVNFENVMLDPDNGINDRTFLTNKYGGRLNRGAVAYSTPEPDNEENPKTKAIITAYEYLLSTNRYNMPPLKEILIRMSEVMNDSFTEADVEKVERTTDDMYVEFMKMIEDPKVQTLLKSLGQYHVATTRYGWKRSMDNVIRAYNQKPDATFVQTRYEWYHRYNRVVKPRCYKNTFSCSKTKL